MSFKSAAQTIKQLDALYLTLNVKLSEKTQKSSKKLYSRTSILGCIFTLHTKVDIDALLQI